MNQSDDLNGAFNQSLAEVPDPRDEGLAILEVLTLAITFLLALGGNTFVLFALRQQSRLNRFSRIYQLMAWLSVADILVAILNILPQLVWDITYRFKGSDSLCRTVKFGQIFCLYFSTYVLLVMSFDRYLAVNRPTQWNSKRLTSRLILMAFVTSVLFASPQLLLFRLSEIKPGVYDCWANFEPDIQKYYVLWFTMSVFFVPLLLILGFYGAICIKIYRYRPSKSLAARCSMSADNAGHQIQFECHQPKDSNDEITRSLSLAKIKTIKLTLTVVVCFIICWSPFCCTQLYLAFTLPKEPVGPLPTIFLLLASLNSCCNPWIYLAFSESLTNHLRHCLGFDRRPCEVTSRHSMGDEDDDDEADSLRPAILAAGQLGPRAPPGNAQMFPLQPPPKKVKRAQTAITQATT